MPPSSQRQAENDLRFNSILEQLGKSLVGGGGSECFLIWVNARLGCRSGTARDSPSCPSRGISLHVKAVTQAIRERTPDASRLHGRGSLVSNGVVRSARAPSQKGANEKPAGLHQNDTRRGIVFLIVLLVKRLPMTLSEALRNIRDLGKGSIDIAVGHKVGTAQGE